MQITRRQILIRDVVHGYDVESDGHVVGYGGRLDIRPIYQREFCYKDKQRDAVIDTVRKGFPLNVIYWATKSDGGFEVLDGQQRILSICQYVNGDYAVDYRFYHNLTEPEKNRILDYPLDVYLCEGDDEEKLGWFKTINISGEKLTDQELRNAVYAGVWTVAAKKLFSANNCVAYRIGKEYVSGTPIRQDFLETALSWIANKEGKTIELYMAEHQNKEDADELWNYFETVIDWVKEKFPNYRREMKGLPWGIWYNECMNGEHKGQIIDESPSVIEAHFRDLLDDDEVQSVKGIYTYIVTGLEKNLNLRQFDVKIARKVYERQGHKCPYCDRSVDGRTYPEGKTEYEFEEMEADHILPWNAGGKTEEDNCQMLCKYHNGHKGG